MQRRSGAATECQLRAATRNVCAVAALAVVANLLFGVNVRAEEPLERTSRKGPVEVTVRLEPMDPLIGDPVTLAVHVVAEKDVELLMPEFGQAMGRFAILDFTTDERVDDDGRTVAMQRYRLQPRRSGKHSIPPIMIEFVDRRGDAKVAPDGMDAYELLTERIAFEVRSLTPTNAISELNPAMLDVLEPRDASSRARWIWIMVGALAIVAAPFAWWFWIATKRRARRRSAYDVAVARLARLTDPARLEPAQVDAFFVELSAIVRWYLENRFELRAEELTTEEFLEAMSQSPDLSPEHQLLLRDFLRRADLVKFAKFQPSAKDIEHSVAAARRFLAETRQDAPLLDHGSDKSPPCAEGGADEPRFVVADVAEPSADQELTRV